MGSGLRVKPIIGGRAVADDNAARLEETPATLLADAAMLLRDPPMTNLVLHETVRALMGVVDRMSVPKDDERLCTLSKVSRYEV